MDYLIEKDQDFSHSYYKVASADRQQYETWIGHLTRERFLADMHSASKQFMQAASMVLSVVEPKSGKVFLSDFKLDTFIAENFYLYAVEGIPRFLMSYKDGVLSELTADEAHQLDFGLELSTYLSYNELFTCLAESLGGTPPAHSMLLVLNMFSARIKLDVAAITGQPRFLSIHELAILAGMKEKSVRNLAHKELDAIPREKQGITLVSAENAISWLNGRRKYQPSQKLTTQAAKDVLVQIESDFFGG